MVLLGAVLVAIPSGEAGFPYQGPGHAGSVPLGDGGASLALPDPATDNRTVVRLDGIPDDACRLVLDENGTYARSHVAWAPGQAVAGIWADVGVVDAPFRVVAHWLTDLNGACTAEVTPDGTLWHDPRGRPFVELLVNETRSFWSGPVGTVFPLAVEVTNNGTLTTEVTAGLPIAQKGWEIRRASPVLNVSVPPLETVVFSFDVFVPRTEQPRMNALALELRAPDWAARPVFFLDLKPPLPLLVEETAPEDGGRGLEPWEPTPREAPAPSIFGILTLFLVTYALRRRLT